jgi:hypothetical protein
LQDLNGRWVVAMADGSIFVQRGQTFIPVKLKDDAKLSQTLQVFPGLANDLIVLTTQGIAVVTLNEAP